MLTISELTNIIGTWSYWDKEPPATIRRKILIRHHAQWASDIAWVIQGVRRCGKSTLLAQIMHALGLDSKRCFLINFEDPRLSGNLNPTLLDQIVETAFPDKKPNRPAYFFFDEIQNVSEWEKWLHVQLERPKGGHFVITGSNASLLAGEFATALTGRHLTLELFPFDFEEYLTLKPRGSLESYLSEGGFPRANTVADPQALLREYFTDIVERDVRRHIAARSTILLTQLAKAVYESAGSEISFRKLAKMAELATDTIKSHLEAFTAAYLCLPCPYFTYSERKRLVRPMKYYPIDLGLWKAVLPRTGQNHGKMLETAVFHELRRRHKQVFYWKGKGEVDFVIETDEGLLPVQVSWDGMKERHTSALNEFKLAFPKALPGRFISRGNAEEFLKIR